LNFFNKIEETINNLILMILEKLKALLPHFIFEIVPHCKHLIHSFKHLLHEKLPKLKIALLKIVEDLKHNLASGLGNFTAFSIYLKSEEFKHNKPAIIKRFFLSLKADPKKASINIAIFAFFTFGIFIVFTNTKKIVDGTHKLRAPASAQPVELVPENEIELKDHKFEVALKAAGGHGGGGGHHEIEIMLDIKIEAASHEQKELLEAMEEKLDVELEAFDFTLSGLPLSEEERILNEKALVIYLNKEFFNNAGTNVINKIALKQSPKKRPAYFGQEDRTFSMKSVDLQIFLEDTKKNRQVSLDYSVVASNRNAVLYFRDNEEKVRDRFSTQIEPIIPRLPIEEEGRGIIKDKIRFELNEMLKDVKIEGKVLDVYIDFLLGS
jgi:hypothetical protein